MNKTANLVIIFGITGDLANRKLIPAINGLVSSDSLPGNTYIIGGGRKNISNYKFDNIHKNLKDNWINVNKQLVKEGHAVEYYGGKR